MKIEFENTHGERLAGRLELPGGTPRAFALFAHCFTCGKDIAAASRIARALAARGFAVLRFDFTGLGGSDGEFANTSFSSNVDDLVSAADWLRTNHRAPGLLVGHSLGGAAVLAAAPRIAEVDAVATIGAPSDVGHIERLFVGHEQDIERDGCKIVEIAGRPFPISRQFLDDVSEQKLLPGLRDIGKAVLVMHSPIDDVVGIDHARKLYQALRHPKSFVTLDDADHLLRTRRDSGYVADILAAWASRYIDDDGDPATPEEARSDDVVVRERAPDAFTQDVRVRSHTLISDEPEHVGGTDLGPDPYGLLLAALGTCTSMTLRMYARHKGLPIRSIAVHLRHEKVHAKDCEECEQETGRVDVIERVLEIDAPELDDAQRQRLLDIADRCPVHRTFEGQKKVRTRLA